MILTMNPSVVALCTENIDRTVSENRNMPECYLKRFRRRPDQNHQSDIIEPRTQFEHVFQIINVIRSFKTDAKTTKKKKCSNQASRLVCCFLTT